MHCSIEQEARGRSGKEERERSGKEEEVHLCTLHSTLEGEKKNGQASGWIIFFAYTLSSPVVACPSIDRSINWWMLHGNKSIHNYTTVNNGWNNALDLPMYVAYVCYNM